MCSKSFLQPACRVLSSLLSRADYGFEYSDEEAEEQDVDIENNYYNSKGALLMP